MLAITTVDLARIQFATTSLYHFLFVPLTLGLAPLVALMQTMWYRSGDEAWLRLTRFFGTLLPNRFAVWAFAHVILVGVTTGATVVFGVACWHFARGRNQEIFLKAAKLALIVLVPVSAVNLGLGSHLGIIATEDQPMKIASTEAQWDTCTGCAFSLFQIGGFTKQDQTPSFSIEIPKVLSFLATGSFNGTVQGITPLQAKNVAQYGRGNYMPAIETVYW